MADHGAIIHFYQGWAPSHESSADGFPIYKDTVMIDILRHPTTHLQRQATLQDFKENPDEYRVFQAQEKARKENASEGYPLVYWPAATPAEIEMLAARGIRTVEVLADFADNTDMPGQLRALAIRAERMQDMQKNFGKYEAMLAERDGEVEELSAQVKEMQHTISAQNAMIDTLKLRVA